MRELKTIREIQGTDAKHLMENNKDFANRSSSRKGKAKYDLNQSKMFEAVGKTLVDSAKLVTSYQFNDNPDANIQEEYKKYAENEVVRENLRTNLRESKSIINTESQRENVWYQKMASDMVFHGTRQMADIRQLPYNAAAALSGAWAGKAVGKALAPKAASALVKRIYSGIGAAGAGAIEETITEASDQFITERHIDAESLFSSALGGAALGGTLGFMLGGTGIELEAKKTTNQTPKTDPLADQVKLEAEMRSNNIDPEVKKGEDISIIADDLEAVAEAKGRNLYKDKIIADVVEVEGATVTEAREIYGPYVYEKIKNNFDEADSLKEFRNVSKKNPEKIIKMIDSVLENESLSLKPENVKALEWGKRILDNKRIKGINFSSKNLLKTLDDLDETTTYKKVFDTKKPFNRKKKQAFTNAEIEAKNYDMAINERIENDFTTPKKQLEKQIRKDLNIPNGAIVKSVNGRKSEIGEIADIEYKIGNDLYYAKIVKEKGRYTGDIYSKKGLKKEITADGKTKIVTESKLRRTTTEEIQGPFTRPTQQDLVRRAYTARYPEIKEEDFFKHISKDTERSYFEFLEMAEDPTLTSLEKIAVQQTINNMEKITTNNYFNKTQKLKDMDKVEIATQTEGAPHYQTVIETMKKWTDGINNKEDVIRFIKEDKEAFFDELEEILTHPEIILTEAETKALTAARTELKKAQLKDLKTKKAETTTKKEKKKIINTSAPIWRDYPFTENLVTKEYFEELLNNRQAHNGKDVAKYALINDLKNDLGIPENAKIKMADVAGYRDRMQVEKTFIVENSVWSRRYTKKTDYYANIVWEQDGYYYYADTGIWNSDGYKGDIYKVKKYERPKKNIVDKFREAEEVNIETQPKLEPKNIMEEAQGFYENKVPTEAEVSHMIDNNVYSEADMESLKEMMTKEAEWEVNRTLGLGETEVTNTSFKTKMNLLVMDVGKRIKKKYNVENVIQAANAYKNKYNINFELKEASLTSGRIAQLDVVKVGDKTEFLVSISKDVKNEDLRIGALRHELEHLRDYIDDPNFDPAGINILPKKTIGETINQGYKGHFQNYTENSFEYSYILNDEINNILTEEGLNKEVVKRLGLDIPDILKPEDIEALENIISEAKIKDSLTATLDQIKKESEKYFSTKKRFEGIIFSKASQSKKTNLGKEFIKSKILLPFERIENQAKNNILTMFRMKDNKGNTMDLEGILDLWEKEKGYSFSDFLFYEGNIPENLKYAEANLLKMREDMKKMLIELEEDALTDFRNIANTVNYNSRLSIEKLIPDEAKKGFIDESGEFKLEEFLSDGTAIADESTGKILTEKQLSLREQFAEQNFTYFNDSLQEFEIKAANQIAEPEEILRAMKRARKVSKGEELLNVVLKNNLDQNPVIKNFMDEHPEFFSFDNLELFDNTAKAAENLERAKINSKKETAKAFFTEDMSSYKGTDKNNSLGTYAHKLSRFKYFEDMGYLMPDNATAFVKSRKLDPRNSLQKFYNDVPAALAIKNTMPKQGYNGIREMFGKLEQTTASQDTKTFTSEMESYIKSEIGEKLGIITKPTQGGFDKAVTKYLGILNRINLTGLKALSELTIEPMGMVRDQIILWGGPNFGTQYKEMVKAFVLLTRKGDDLNKINTVLSGSDSVSQEMFNIVNEGLKDVTGYRKKKIMQNGSKGDKIYYQLTNGLDKFNMYGFTQKALKLVSYRNTATIMKNWKNFKNLDEVIKGNSYIERTFKDLDISQLELDLIKKLEDTESFKDLNLFNKQEFSNLITKEDLETGLGKKISYDEFLGIREIEVNKIESLYDRITSDISPTETSGASRYTMETIENPIHRNFIRLMGNFKNSIQEQWRRSHKSFYMANVSNETGKFDWTNRAYQKRMLSTLFNIGVMTTIGNLATDTETYLDPFDKIEETIEEMWEDPTSLLWQMANEQFNVWGLTTGSSIANRTMQLGREIAEGDGEKAAKTMMKLGLNNFNYKMLEKIKDIFD